MINLETVLILGAGASKPDTSFDEFQNNKLAIVTFNYDRSLEQYFYQRLKHTYSLAVSYTKNRPD